MNTLTTIIRKVGKNEAKNTTLHLLHDAFYICMTYLIVLIITGEKVSANIIPSTGPEKSKQARQK